MKYTRVGAMLFSTQSTVLVYSSYTVNIICNIHSYARYYGPESLQTALTYHLLARVHSFLGDFRAALYHEKLTYNIYNKKVSASQVTIESRVSLLLCFKIVFLLIEISLLHNCFCMVEILSVSVPFFHSFSLDQRVKELKRVICV